MIPTKAVKTTALTILRGHWANSVVIALIPVFATVLITLIGSVLTIPFGAFSAIIDIFLVVFFLSPLWLGALRVYWRMGNGIYDTPAETFYYFENRKNYLRALSFSIKFALNILVFEFIISIPVMVFDFLTSGYLFEIINMPMPVILVELKFLLYLLEIIVLVLTVMHLIRYYLSAFLLVSNEDMKPGECIKRGEEIGKHTKGGFANCILSYTGWILLTVFMIPLIFTAPYLIMSYMVACRFDIAYYNRLGQNSAPVYEV